MDDSELVAATVSGDHHARAAIYDRYTDRIHDFAHAVLRDRVEAGQVMREAFLVGFEHLERLGEPARLGPWLFAIAHHATVTRASELEGPEAPDDLTEVVPAVSPRPDRPAFSAAEGPTAPTPATRSPPPSPDDAKDESAQVWQAAGWLGPRDRALLDLHVRQGYDGRDLADAVGVSPIRLDTMLSRLLAHVERSVGALLVARSSRRDCPRLAELLAGWDGVMTPEMRARITSHVDDCETCNSRRRLVLNPLLVLAAVPQVPAPARLRALVLGDSGGGPGGRRAGGGVGDWIFDADGFPYQGGDRRIDPAVLGPVPAAAMAGRSSPEDAGAGAGAGGGVRSFRRAVAMAPGAPTTVLPAALPAAPPPDAGDRRWVVVGVLAGVAILLGGMVALAASRGHGSRRVAVTVATTATPAPVTTPTTGAPATTATTRSPAPTTVPPGHFVVGAKGLDFGITGTTQSLVVGNDGVGPLAFTATTAYAALTIAPAGGTIQPGANATLAVTLNRTNLPVGPLSTTIAISSGAGTAIVAVVAQNDPGPAITGEQVTPDTVRPSDCASTPPSGGTQATVTAQITSLVPLNAAGVRLRWQPPPGGDTKMTLTGPAAAATLGPFATAPANQAGIEWWLTATDTAGATTTTAHHYLAVSC